MTPPIYRAIPSEYFADFPEGRRSITHWMAVDDGQRSPEKGRYSCKGTVSWPAPDGNTIGGVVAFDVVAASIKEAFDKWDENLGPLRDRAIAKDRVDNPARYRSEIPLGFVLGGETPTIAGPSGSVKPVRVGDDGRCLCTSDDWCPLAQAPANPACGHRCTADLLRCAGVRIVEPAGKESGICLKLS